MPRYSKLLATLGTLRGRTRDRVALRRLLVLLALGGATGLSGCSQPSPLVPLPPPTVTVAHPVQSYVPESIEVVGTTEASEFAEVRARVKGVIQKIHFKPNQIVNKDDQLYDIEPDTYVAAVNQAKAALASATAEKIRATATFDLTADLRKKGAASEEELSLRDADKKVAEAAVDAAQAALDDANTNLKYTKITAPISGQIGKTLVYEGNLVGNNEATHLTTIVKYDPTFATFTVSERELLRYRENRAGPPKLEERNLVPLELGRSIETDYPFVGMLNFTDLAVDRNTGTYLVRGEFPNPDLKILPGLYVRIRIPDVRYVTLGMVPPAADAAEGSLMSGLDASALAAQFEKMNIDPNRPTLGRWPIQVHQDNTVSIPWDVAPLPTTGISDYVNEHPVVKFAREMEVATACSFYDVRQRKLRKLGDLVSELTNLETQRSLLVPDAAIGADQASRYVMVVDGENIARRRNVTIGVKVGDLRVILEGLEATDRVIVNGIQRAIPDKKVTIADPNAVKKQPVDAKPVDAKPAEDKAAQVGAS